MGCNASKLDDLQGRVTDVIAQEAEGKINPEQLVKKIPENLQKENIGESQKFEIGFILFLGLDNVKAKMSSGLSQQNLFAETLLKSVSEKEELPRNKEGFGSKPLHLKTIIIQI